MRTEVRKQKSEDRKKKTFICVLSSVFCIIALIFSGACKEKVSSSKAAAAKAAQAAAPTEIEVKGPKVEEEVYVYDKKGKRDPFVSLVVTEEKPVKGETPLENYDVGAIKILGIVWNEKGYYAEIVLPDGKAYTLKEGMTIGVHKGKIQRITKGSIVIKEYIKDYKGEIKPKETILKLREEEEE